MILTQPPPSFSHDVILFPVLIRSSELPSLSRSGLKVSGSGGVRGVRLGGGLANLEFLDARDTLFLKNSTELCRNI